MRSGPVEDRFFDIDIALLEHFTVRLLQAGICVVQDESYEVEGLHNEVHIEAEFRQLEYEHGELEEVSGF